jgi:hypothetical protein
MSMGDAIDWYLPGLKVEGKTVDTVRTSRAGLARLRRCAELLELGRVDDATPGLLRRLWRRRWTEGARGRRTGWWPAWAGRRGARR